VTLDGSRSIEFDGMPLEYDWWPGIPSEQQIQKPTVTLPTGTHVIYLKVYNRYTDRWSHNTDEVVIIADDKPPVTSLDIGEPKFIDASSNIFVTSATSFTLTAEDNPGGSGVNSTAYRIYNNTYDTSWTTYTKPFNLTGLSEDTYNIDYNSTDKAGNVEATNTTTVILDNTAPTTTLTIGEPKYISHTTYVTSATLYKLVATDNAGSGVAHTHYKIGVDPWTEGTSFNIIGPDGTYVCKWYSIDNLGNVETENSETVILDNTSPTTTLTIGELKYISDTIYVTPDTPFTLKATDTGSGVYSTAYRIRSATYDSGWQIYAAPFKLTSLADGTFTIEYYSTDNVKNVEPTQTVRITLFSWNYVFKDTQGRGTILKINTFHKFFQFIAPSNDYGIRKATKMLWLVPGTSIKIEHRDSQLILYATIDVKLDFCYAIAWDLQTGKINYLYDPAGIES